ncbi:MAG: glycosyltransferase family 4 protein [Anaerolineales bacterium]|nr:glycosyltransferase family 4 protein [Anaerolineales bacterium]
MRLFVVEPRATGGMIHYAYQLCTALARQGASVTLVTSQDYELASFSHNFTVEPRLKLWARDAQSMSPPRSRLAAAWRKTYRTVRRGGRAVQLIYQWLGLMNYLLAQQPDLVQFGSIGFPFEALFLARLRRQGLILTQICHEFEQRERGNGLWARLTHPFYAGIYDNFSAIFLHAENNRQRFLSLFPISPELTHVIPHGNETLFLTSAAEPVPPEVLRQRYGLAPDEPVVLFFGTLTPSKGLPELLQAFALVRQESQARLVVAGFPSKFVDVNELQAMATALGLSEAVIFDTRYIPVEEVGALMGLARVVVYPYRSSTQSGALQVAYAFGRPVIATQVGGLPEVVEEGRSGFLVPPNSPGALAAAILKIVDNPQLGAEMGAYARHLSETRYAWEPIANQILTVYQRLLIRKTKPAQLQAKSNEIRQGLEAKQ